MYRRISLLTALSVPSFRTHQRFKYFPPPAYNGANLFSYHRLTHVPPRRSQISNHEVIRKVSFLFVLVTSRVLQSPTSKNSIYLSDVCRACQQSSISLFHHPLYVQHIFPRSVVFHPSIRLQYASCSPFFSVSLGDSQCRRIKLLVELARHAGNNNEMGAIRP